MPKPKVRLFCSANCSERRMVKYCLYLWRVFTSDRVYLWPLMSISHISLITAILCWDRHRSGLSPQYTQVIQAFKRIVLDPIKITSAYCTSVCESGRWFSIDFLNCQSYSVCGKWLSPLSPSPELKMATVGFWEQRIFMAICEQYCRAKYSLSHELVELFLTTVCSGRITAELHWELSSTQCAHGLLT